MRCGVIGYGNNSGGGNWVYRFKEMLPEIVGQFIIPNTVKDTVLNVCPRQFDGKASNVHPDLREFKQWYHSFRPDIILILETPFNWEFMKYMKEMTCKIVYFPMLDSLPMERIQYAHLVDLWIAHNNWTLGLIQSKNFKSILKLGVPIPVTKFLYKERGLGRGLLIHHAGFLGMFGRKGTEEVLLAYQKLKKEKMFAEVRLRIYSQIPIPLAVPDNVELIVGNQEDGIKMFDEGDVYVAPSKREGIGLPILEAMSCGFPVLTTDAEPMREYVPCERMKVKVESTDKGLAKVNIDDLAMKMGYAAITHLEHLSIRNRQYVEDLHSYEVLRPLYLNVLKTLIGL